MEATPQWAVFPFITTGYRVGHFTHWDCIKSMFCLWHNESFNAWSMVFVALLASGLYGYVLGEHWLVMESIDLLVFTSFFLSCVIHTPFSLAYHTFMCMSERHKHFYRSLDLCFIFIAASLFTFSLCFYVFPFEVTIAMTSLSVTVTFFMSSFLFQTKLNDSDPSYKRLIVSMVGMSVLLYVMPMIYGSLRDQRVILYGVGAIGTMVVEAMVYVFCIPERYVPVVFDSFGNSHNIMHLLLMVSYLFEFLFLFEVSGLHSDN